MKKLLRVVSALSLIVASAYNVPADTWQSFTNSSDIGDMSLNGYYLWCATSGGVVRWDTRDMSSTKFTTYDGLGDNRINAVESGKDGIVYAGTRNGGFSFFFGNRWTTHYGRYEGSPNRNSIYSLAVGLDGTVWASGASGMFTGGWNGLELSNVFSDYPLRHSNAMCTAPDGSIWVGCNGEIFRVYNQSLDVYKTTGSSSYEIVAVEGTADGDVWASLRIRGDFGYRYSKLSRFDGESWSDYRVSTGLPDENVNAIASGPDGTVWFGCDEGVMTFDGTTWRKLNDDTGLLQVKIQSIAVDSIGVVYAGTPQGLLRFNGIAWSRHVTENEPSYNYVRGAAVNSDGTLWIGTWGKGVSSYDGTTWRHFTENDGLGENYIRDVDISPYDNTVWAASDWKISSYDGKSWQTFTCDELRDASYVNDMAVGQSGGVWIAAFGEGFLRLLHGEWIQYKSVDGISLKNATAAYEDSKGFFWGGTEQGLYRYDGDTWQMMKAGIVKTITEGTDGTIWTGANTISRYDGAGWKSYKVGAKLAQAVEAMVCDRDGVLWIGLSKEGVVKFDKGGWTWSGSQPVGDTVSEYSLAAAHNGGVWIGTHSRGVFQVNGPVLSVESNDTRPCSSMSGVFPNPFNPSTTIEFTIPTASDVTLSVYSLSGQKVAALVDSHMSSGKHTAVFDGSGLASGLYFYRLEAGGTVKTGKMMLMK